MRSGAVRRQGYGGAPRRGGLRGTEYGRQLYARALERAAEARGKTDLVALIGAAVKLERRGALFVGLCPFHGEKTPSFTVYPAGSARDPHFHCFGCAAHGDAIAFVMLTRAVDFRGAVDWLLGGPEVGAGVIPGRSPGDAPTMQASGAIDGQRRAERERQEAANRLLAAAKIWEASRPIVAGDPADRYLRGRGLVPVGAGPRARPDPGQPRGAAPTWPDSLRLHPGLPYPREYGRYAALVARVDNVRGELVGIHRTYLAERDGRWIKAAVAAPRLSLGAVKGGAIRLAPENWTLGLAEGIEDALSAMQIFGLPCWSAIDAGKLAAVELPFGIGEVTIFADQDPAKEKLPEGIGIARARALAARLRAEGRKVTILAPRDGCKDFNDQLRMETA